MDPPSKGQLRKIEKDKRKKQYHDLQVQGTNNSSIVSKRSVEMIYTSKLSPNLTPWFKIFVPKGKRRSPAINRGYWLRMESIKRLILRIVANNPAQHIQVINLGCGFDPLPYQMLEEFPDFNTEFIDFDYPELVKNKLAMIQASEETLLVIGPTSSAVAPVLLSSNKYKLIGCDLKNDKLYQQLLDIVTNPDSVKIFVAEVSLAYMKYEDANKIISISSGVQNSHFLILEQLLPVGKYHSFAQKMLYHFQHLSSPLQCVENYPTKKDQINRFKQYYPYVEIEDLFGNWSQLVEDELKVKIGAIEQFDEWEEFIVFCHHYAIVHATNSPNSLVYSQQSVSPEVAMISEQSILFDVNQLFFRLGELDKLLELKFPAVCHYKQYPLVHGGMSQTRNSDLLLCDVQTGNIIRSESETSEPTPRMCHTITNVDGTIVMIGGRGRPGQPYKDVYRVDIGPNMRCRYEKMPDLPQERYRHASVAAGSDQILVFGGLADADNGQFMMYDSKTGHTATYEPNLAVPNLLSCGMDYDTESNVGYIVGGIINEDLPQVSDKLYRFKLDFAQRRVLLERLWQHDLIARMGCQVKIVPDQHKIMVIGGVATTSLLTAHTSIITIDVNTLAVGSVPIDSTVWAQSPPTLIGFGVAATGPNQITVLAGGAVCYSFGSSYNGVYTITI